MKSIYKHSQKKSTIISVIAILFGLIFYSSCKKEPEVENSSDASKGEIIFSFKTPQTATENDTIPNFSFVNATITDAAGKKILDSVTFDLSKTNDDYISKTIQLPTGKYAITDLLILNNDKKVVYVAPKSNSDLAHLVNQPLPISFEIQKNVILKLSPEVLKIKPATNDSITPIQTTTFLISSFIYDESLKKFASTPANLTIMYDSVVNKYAIDNKPLSISITSNAADYTIYIEKDGYQTWTQTYTADELKGQNGTLMIILKRQPADCATSWSNFFGTQDEEYGWSVIQTPDGGALMVGSTYHFDTSVERMYVVKTNCNGEKEWGKFFNEVSVGSKIISMPDGSYIIYGAVNYTSIALMKIDSKGNKQWLRLYENGNIIFANGKSLTTTLDGGFLLCGNYLTNTTKKTVMIKTDNNGNEIWRTIHEDALRNVGSSCVKETQDGNIYLLLTKSQKDNDYSNICLGLYDKYGKIQWVKEYPNQIRQNAFDFVLTKSNKFLIVGTEGVGGNIMSPSILLFSVDLNGIKQWEKRYKSFENENYFGAQANAICSAVDGDYFIAGTTNEEEDIYVIKVDEQGNTKYERTFGGINYFVNGNTICLCGQDCATNIAPTKDGGCFITGFTTNFGNGQNDAFILRLDNNGNAVFGSGRMTVR